MTTVPPSIWTAAGTPVLRRPAGFDSTAFRTLTAPAAPAGDTFGPLHAAARSGAGSTASRSAGKRTTARPARYGSPRFDIGRLLLAAGDTFLTLLARILQAAILLIGCLAGGLAALIACALIAVVVPASVMIVALWRGRPGAHAVQIPTRAKASYDPRRSPDMGF